MKIKVVHGVIGSLGENRCSEEQQRDCYQGDVFHAEFDFRSGGCESDIADSAKAS